MSANTIGEVISNLDAIVLDSAANSDRCGYFAALYKKVTIVVSKKIQARYFDDNQRMERLDVVFANRYLDAYSEYKANQKCSKSWQIAFDATLNWQPMVIDQLFLGMNAHIGLDLGIAAATVAPGNQLHSIQSDFIKINQVLSELVDEVKADLYSMWPLSKSIAQLHIGSIEQAVADFSMSLARDAAWKLALDYSILDTEEAKTNCIELRDESVVRFSQKLLNPGSALKLLKASARLFETGSVKTKIERLND
ncbi:MAG: hypothetical protein JNL65_11670 [Saprospiraceae bacterium]|nr:hypothetical protein [Saprospiraceae bacterium]